MCSKGSTSLFINFIYCFCVLFFSFLFYLRPSSAYQKIIHCSCSLCAFAQIEYVWHSVTNAAGGPEQQRRSMTMSPTTPPGGGSLKIGRPRSRSKSPFRSFRWKRGSSSRVAESDDEGGNQNQDFLYYCVLV